MHDRGIDEDELGDFLPYTDLGLEAYRLDGGSDHTCAILVDFTVKVGVQTGQILVLRQILPSGGVKMCLPGTWYVFGWYVIGFAAKVG